MVPRAWPGQVLTQFIVLLALALCAVGADFGTAFVPTFKFSEHYSQSVVYDRDFEEYTTATSARLSGTLRLSTQGVNINSFQTDTDASIDDAVLDLEVGNLDIELAIADGEKSTDSAGRRIVTWILSGTNPDTFESIDEAGTVTLRYSAEELTVAFSVEDVPDDYNIMAPDEAGNDDSIDDFPQFLSFALGDYELANSTVYVTGTAKLYDKTVGQGDNEEEFTDLPIVNLDGEFDVIRPTATITSPTNHSTVNADTITVQGSASDKHGVFQVLIQVNDGAFVAAVLGLDGKFILENVKLKKGRNVIVAKAVDFSANERLSASRTVTYSLLSDLTVTATGTGSGTVTASYFEPLHYSPDQPSPVRIAERKTDSNVELTAKPGPNSLFDYWESTNVELTFKQAGSSRLVFAMRPGAILTARFTENPFGPVKGKYAGLYLSADSSKRGFVTIKLSARGGFTLVAKMGNVTVPLKGVFPSSGIYAGEITVRGVTYDYQFSVELADGVVRQITGFFGNGVFFADLAPYNKKTAPAPAELVGTFNVLISPHEEADVSFPGGIGFARVTVSPGGKVKCVGKLGDGTALSIGVPLSEQGTWPFFAALYQRKGSISGMVQFDLTAPESDLSAVPDWYKPDGAKPSKSYPSGFEGQSVLSGARFRAPEAGKRLFLEASAGTGTLSFDAPAEGALPLLADDFGVTLDSANALVVAANSTASALGVIVTIDSTTGLFSGSFLEAGVQREFRGIVVGSKVNRAGGVFSRGTGSGSVSIAP